MAYPAFGTAGTGFDVPEATTGTATYPATVNSGDIAIMILHVRDPDAGATLVLDENGTSNWEPMGDQVAQAGGGGTYISRLFWRCCDGSEDGATQSVLVGSNAAVSPRIGRIFTISGAVASGTPFEGYLTNQGTTGAGTAIATDSITTSVAECLGFAIYCFGDDHSSTIDADWTNQTSQSTTSGNDASYYVDTRQIATASTEAASERTYASSSESYVTFSFAIKPAGASFKSAWTINSNQVIQ